MLALLALLGTAEAGSSIAYMWGAGPQVSTVIYPTRFPGSFPSAATRSGWDYTASRGDIEFALRGAFYLNMESRLTGRLGLGGGPGWYTRWADVGMDRMLSSNSGFHTLVGANLGLGRDRFTDDLGQQLETSFVVPRVQFGGIYRNKTQAYELGVYAAYHAAFEHLNPVSDEVIEGQGARYGMLGIEATVWFGDFTPPKSKKNNKKKK